MLHFLQPKLQERQFPLPEFFLYPIFQLSDQRFVHNSPIIDYSKSADLSINRENLSRNNWGNRPRFAALPAFAGETFG
jgi:hypothetical protein